MGAPGEVASRRRPFPVTHSYRSLPPTTGLVQTNSKGKLLKHRTRFVFACRQTLDVYLKSVLLDYLLYFTAEHYFWLLDQKYLHR